MTENPVPPPDHQEPPAWFKDQRAQKEERYYPDEDRLSGQRRKNDLLWLGVYGFMVVALMVLFALLFVGSLVAWAWHYIAPVSWGWLTPDQLSKIQSVIFSGSLGGIVSFIAQRQLSK